MIKFKTHETIVSISKRKWEKCSGNENPFLGYDFLWCLEKSNSVGQNKGWIPNYISLEEDNNIIAVIPLYIKLHSQGEYVFDHSWAHLYQSAGGQYYPKLQVSIPFSPIAGNRILINKQHEKLRKKEIIRFAGKVIVERTRTFNFSSAHITFCTNHEAKILTDIGFLHRIGEQFHWQNSDYIDFNDFLTSLSSRKRKSINKERKYIKNCNIQILKKTGADISDSDWDHMFLFYQNTSDKKWGNAYLNRKFFDLLSKKLNDNILLILAKEKGNIVAGALHIIGSNTLFGRYWGSFKNIKYLHFELCYYQAIEWAIENNINFVEGGAQGLHKVQRGYLPVQTNSLHYIRNDSFKNAVENFLNEESSIIDKDIAFIKNSYSPFKKK